jgi:type VI secretion system secreted protein VgrG
MHMDLIGQLTQQLGLEPDTAQAASGSVFQLIQQHAPAGAFQQLLGAAPEVTGWMDKSRSAAPAAGGGGLGGMLGGGGGGGLGGLMGAAAGALGGAGGATGQMAALTGALGRFGISPDVAMKVLPLALQFIQSKVGPGGAQALAAGMPLLQQFLAGGGQQGGGGLGGALGKLF